MSMISVSRPLMKLKMRFVEFVDKTTIKELAHYKLTNKALILGVVIAALQRNHGQ